MKLRLFKKRKKSVIFDSVGCGNVVACRNMNVYIDGNNNKINLGQDICVVDYLNVMILEECENGSISVADGTSFWGTTIQTTDIDSCIKVGADCMFSYNTLVMNSDGHSIFQNGQLLNRGKTLIIGNHCWVGYNAVVYKNVKLPDNTIVARNAFVSGQHALEANCILGGIPARVIKTDVTWSRDTINQTLKKQPQE